MTAPQARQHFEAVRVDSIYGGNRTAYLLRPVGASVVDARVLVPFGTGNEEADAAAWKDFQRHLRAYTRNGTLPPRELIAQ